MLKILNELPVWLQFMIIFSWLGLAAIIPCALIKSLNAWPIFFGIFLTLMICLGPSLINF